MARLPIQVEDGQIIEYGNGTDTEVWMAPQALSRQNPALAKFAASIYAMNLGGTTPLLNLGLDAATRLGLPERLPHGFRLRTDGGQVFTVDARNEPIDSTTGTRFIPVGRTDIPIDLPTATALVFPTQVPATTVATAEYSRYLVFYSCAEASFKADGEEISYRNFGDGVFEVGRKSKMKVTFDTMGFATPGDTILKLVRRLALSTTESIAVRYIPPDHDGYEFICEVKSDDRSSKVDAGYEAKFTYSVTKAPTPVDFTPS